MDTEGPLRSAQDAGRRLGREAKGCYLAYQAYFQVSPIQTMDPEIYYAHFEPVPGSYSPGTLRKFANKDEASDHSTILHGHDPSKHSLMRIYPDMDQKDLDNLKIPDRGGIDPSPEYVLKPDAHLQKYTHRDVDGFFVKYSVVIEKLQFWIDNFAANNRSDDEIYELLGKLGPAMEYRYKTIGSIGDLTTDIVITDQGQVLYWNWDLTEEKPDFKREVRALREFIRVIYPLAADADRLLKFESFLTAILGEPNPPTHDLELWVFSFPVFMNEEGQETFLDNLSTLVFDDEYQLGNDPFFLAQIANYEDQTLNWAWNDCILKGRGASNTVLLAILRYQQGYERYAWELPRFVYNCIKHYNHTVKSLNKRMVRNNSRFRYAELSRPGVVAVLCSYPKLKLLREDLYSALYMGVVSLARGGPTGPIPTKYSPLQVFNMIKGRK